MESTDKLLSKIAKEKILIIGDVMIDAYMWGNVSRISPEAPVPVVAITRREQRLGGAANVALNIESLGATPIICSVLGNDDNGREFQQIMYQNNMDRRGIITSDNRITTVKSRVIGNNMHIVRVDEESTNSLSSFEEEMLLDRIKKIIKNLPIDAIIFQDYDKGNITPAVIEQVTRLAQNKGIFTSIDPKHRNFSNYRNANLFKPNLKELKEGLNCEIDESDETTLTRDLEQAAKQLYDKQHNDIVLTTLSNKGMFACDFRGDAVESVLIPAQVRTISDVSGAGDTVISVATLAMAAGLNLYDAVRCANAAGGVVCEQVGVVPIDKERLREEIDKLNIHF